LLSGFVTAHATGGALRFVGELGNSTGSESAFAGKPAPGMGPVFDEQMTLWERAGGTRLNRDALDGRLLASFDIPHSDSRNDQLTRVGDRLVMHIRGSLYVLPMDEAPGAEPQPLEARADVMSSSAHDGRVVLFDRKTHELSWLNPTTGERTAIAAHEGRLFALHIDEGGTVYAFGGNKVYAWKGGRVVDGFPKDFRGDRPQKIGDHWYSHSWHGTIHRLNDRFEPDPGVVLGGVSGSFIGYLPQSADVTNGRGLVRVRDGVFAVSGMGGVVQLLTWNGKD